MNEQYDNLGLGMVSMISDVFRKKYHDISNSPRKPQNTSPPPT